MKCEKCGGEWIPPKSISVSLTNCPFCNAPLLNPEVANSYTDMGDFLRYLVSLYDADLYGNCQKLNNLISDLYRGDDRMKRAYRRAILDDSLPQRIYALSLKPLNEREALRNQIVAQFSEANFYPQEFGKQVVDSFVKGLGIEIVPPISTKATEEDGEWIDEYGVTYSADRRKLIRGNKDLKTYNVKEGTVVICDRAFCYCSDLTRITIPNSVTHIGDKAFGMCNRLTSITLPNSVTHIGKCPFEKFVSLTVESGGHFVLENNLLFTKDKKTILWCSYENREVCIPNSVTHIGDEAFFFCENLASITLPNSVTHIGDSAFQYCDNLTSITIPNSVTHIGDSAFYGCCFLTRINIPNSVTHIGEEAFSGCYFLTRINISNSVTHIGGGAFNKKISLTVESGGHFVLENNILFTKDKKMIIWCSYENREVCIPNSVTHIGDSAFASCCLTRITIPNSVTHIGNEAFVSCDLTHITIPNSVTYIGRGAFLECKNLTHITLPNSVTHIGNEAFAYCENLTHITLPNLVTHIDGWVFFKCNNLTTIAIPPGTTRKFKSLLDKEYHPLLKETV